MPQYCIKCKKGADSDLPIFRCDGCASHWCKLCGDLSASEIKVLQLKNARTLRFFCVDCLGFNTAKMLRDVIRDKADIISSKERIIELLERELAEKRGQLECCGGNGGREVKTFASVTKQGYKDGENLPCILIKPRIQQRGSKTRTEIQSKIKPSKVSVGVNMIKELRNGSVLLKCNSAKATENMKNEAQAALGQDYTVTETKLLSPSVTISNISKGLERADILEALRSQNDFLTEQDEFSIQAIKEAKSGNSLYAILRCNGSCFRKMMGAHRMNVGFDRCPVYESLGLRRCFKCWGFNHLARECGAQEDVCHKCAGCHSSRKCGEAFSKCTNCLYHNGKFGSNFDVKHDATDRACPVYKQKLEIFKKRINYNILNI